MSGVRPIGPMFADLGPRRESRFVDEHERRPDVLVIRGASIEIAARI